jgi:S-adenosylmethionine decarboxylase
MTEYWGYHALFDCLHGGLEQVRSRENIKDFIEELVPSIGMRSYGEPIIEHFATHDIDAAGHSLVQLIETSSITAHFVDRSGDLYVDVFSCLEYDVQKTQSIVQKYFSPESIRVTCLARQA